MLDTTGRIGRKLFHVVRNVRMRSRERRMPLELDDHVLRDIGLTRMGYRFFADVSDDTVPDQSQKQQESSRSAAVFSLGFKRNRIPQT